MNVTARLPEICKLSIDQGPYARKQSGRRTGAAISLLIVCLVSTSGCDSRNKETPAPPNAAVDPKAAAEQVPVWQSDMALAKKLDKTFELDQGYRCSLRHPVKYKHSDVGLQYREAECPFVNSAQSSITLIAWTKERFTPYLLRLLVAMEQHGTNVPVPTREEFIAKVLKLKASNMQNLTQSTPTKGRIDGIVFSRCDWSADSPTFQRKLYGFVLTAVERKRLIAIEVQSDQTPESQEYRLMEAAALSFKKM